MRSIGSKTHVPINAMDEISSLSQEYVNFKPAIQLPASSDNIQNEEYEYDYVKENLFNTKTSAQVEALKKKNDALQERCNVLESLVSALQIKNQNLLAQLEERQRKTGGHEANIAIIRSYSPLDIQTLLDRMELQKYIVTFAEEKINGALFVELDEDILYHDLGVKSAIHRKRLMRIISGREGIGKIMGDKLRTLV